MNDYCSVLAGQLLASKFHWCFFNFPGLRSALAILFSISTSFLLLTARLSIFKAISLKLNGPGYEFFLWRFSVLVWPSLLISNLWNHLLFPVSFWEDYSLALFLFFIDVRRCFVLLSPFTIAVVSIFNACLITSSVGE